MIWKIANKDKNNEEPALFCRSRLIPNQHSKIDWLKKWLKKCRVTLPHRNPCR